MIKNNTMQQDELVTRAKAWLSYEYDPSTREQVQWLLDNDAEGLAEAFSQDLAFGTGGLRGLMGVGTNRMNIYTVGRATQGLANYLLSIPSLAHRPLSVAIAYDSRNSSETFAKTAADTLAANGIRVYLYEGVRPTPQLSFTVRAMRCHAGIVITASHNPKEYNGYKVYGHDGAQVVAPHDKAIIDAVKAINNYEQVKRNGDRALIIRLGESFNEMYVNALLESCLRLDVVAAQHDMPIVYTPIHGAGGKLTPLALRRMGFTQVQMVDKQREPDGDFPTVTSPNPEDPQAMQLALELGESIEATIVLANDPDVDRLGVYVRNAQGALQRLDGNQIAILLTYYVCVTQREKGALPARGYIVRTVVTSPLLDAIAKDFGLKVYYTLTGFKHIAACIAQREEKETYVCGGEESHGFLVGDLVRDKDGVQACMLFAEMAAWCKSMGKSVIDFLEEIYAQYGVMGHAQVSLVRKGLEGAKEISNLMDKFRDTPPTLIDGETVTVVRDYLTQRERHTSTGKEKTLALPQSNVLQWETKEGTLVTVRPSGTEPKIKFYACAKDKEADSGTKGSIVKAQDRVERILQALVVEKPS